MELPQGNFVEAVIQLETPTTFFFDLAAIAVLVELQIPFYQINEAVRVELPVKGFRATIRIKSDGRYIVSFIHDETNKVGQIPVALNLGYVETLPRVN